MKWVFILLLLSIGAEAEDVSSGEAPLSDDNDLFEMDQNVYTLTDNNFDDFIKHFETFLAMFYSPMCGHCKAFAPVYEEAAARVSIPFVKVDATVEKALAARYQIESYPTLKFWLRGEGPVDYDGGRDIDELVDWLESRTDPNYKPKPDEVVTLTSENFDEFVNNEALSLVEFYAPWCGHCKRLAPEYEKAAKYLKDQSTTIKLAKVDATVEKDLAEKYGVEGFPTLKIMRYGRRFDYNGPRDARGIASYMIEQSKPAAKKLSNVGSIERFMEKDDITIVGFFTSDSSALEAYSDSAEMLREEFKSMGYTEDSSTLKKYNAKPNDIIIFYPSLFHSKFEPKSRTFNKLSATSEELVAFFRDHCTPLVGKRTKKNAAFRYNKLPLVVVYYNADFSLQYREGSEFWRQKVLSIAQKYQKDKYRFAVADEEEFADELQNVGLGDSGLEHNVVVFGYDGKKYPMDPNDFDGDLDENLEGFMKKVSSGRAKPFVKSSPLPRDEKGPVRTLVASNFEKVVNDESKDVLVFFYAPWCGHCKSFEPKYVQLAEELKKTQSNLILAKFDATANDIPHSYTVEGFPTIYFVPSGKKSTPIKYEGNRSKEDIMTFLKKNAVKSFQEKEEL